MIQPGCSHQTTEGVVQGTCRCPHTLLNIFGAYFSGPGKLERSDFLLTWQVSDLQSEDRTSQRNITRE